MHNLVSKVRGAIAHSEFIRAVGSVRPDGGRSFALGNARVRPLSVEEVRQLERLGNSSEDWSRVQVAEGFEARSVRQSTFLGDVILGRFRRKLQEPRGWAWASGICRSTVANCIIGHDALVQDVRLLLNYAIGESVFLADCGRIRCTGKTSFGNGAEVPLGSESGGCKVPVFAELGMELASDLVRSRSDSLRLDQYREAVATYAAQATSSRGIIGRGALVRSTPTVEDTYVGPCAQVDGATLVADSTLLSSPDEPAHIGSGAWVRGSLLQWGSHVSTMAIVDRSLLTEHAHASRHAKVTASILGPNTGVAEGEVTACVLGPFVGFHHQALLIATLWPEGKGNVSHGANVGANHTSRAPDQELRLGEGAFLGLGVNIRMPADFSRAPYTMIACGVTTLPQKVTFPFSLITTPSAFHPAVPPAYNQIIPAWVLSDNLFALRRNVAKCRARNKARRTRFSFKVFRPETVDLMRDACRRLGAVRRPRGVYTEREIPGLGKNFMLEAHRQAAIDAYRLYIAYYALLGLKEQVEAFAANGRSRSIPELLTRPTDQLRWEHQRQVLRDELRCTDVSAGLRRLPGMLEQVARDVERSKAKDDERGARVIEDYGNVHVRAADDPLVRQTREETAILQRELQELLAALPGPGP